MIAEPILQQIKSCSSRTRSSKTAKPDLQTIDKESLRELVRGRLNTRRTDRRELGSQCYSQTDTSKVPTKRQLMELVDASKLDCPICLELAVSPIMLICGHICCLKCFQESSLYSQRCPLCRHDQGLQDPRRSQLAQTIIQEIILPKSSQCLEYLCREGDFINWEKQRIVDVCKLKAGEIIDFRDDSGKWRAGCFRQVVYEEKKEPIVLIKYRISGEPQTQHAEIPLKSRRLAKFGFFTRSNYLKERTNPTQFQSMLDAQIAPIDISFNHEQHMDIQQDSSLSFVYQEDLELPMQLFAHQMQEMDGYLPFM